MAEGLVGWGTGMQAWVVAFNPTAAAQAVTVTLYPERGTAPGSAPVPVTWTGTLGAHTRQSWAVHERLTGAFAAEVAFAAGVGVAALAQWDREMSRPAYVPGAWRCEVWP